MSEERTATDDPRPPLWRWQHVIAAVGAAAAVIGTFAVLADEGGGRTVGGTPPTAAPPSARDSAPAAEARLGVDVPADTTAHCRAPGTATGSAWQFGVVRIDGRAVGPSYHCNLFAGAEGSLDFLLGRSYRELRATIGFADDSGALDHRARFEVIAEGELYVAEPRVLRVGQTAELVVDVRGRSRLRLRVVEQGRSGGSGGFSKPVWADAVLVR
ncbi:MAG: NPCBM/NEW2 domain-containing protein [Actinobacteria bacterium]|nr:NPCBM/NEW2 domain-containing protein [Actinomycetota bacterium]